MSGVAVGGQAVIEGVMMRSPRALAVAVRKQNGEIAVREMVWRKVFPDWKFLRWPFIRGAVVLIESMANGKRALTFASSQALGEDEDGDVGGVAGALLALFAIVLSVGLFIAAPHYSASYVGGLVGAGDVSNPLFHLFAGVFKISIFFGYVLLLSRLPEMKRIFQYHGAEHKSIYAFESGLPLTVENARKQVRFHPRCGTAFIFAVAGIAVLFWSVVFPVIQPLFYVTDIKWLQNFIYVLIKIPMMFPIAGIAYEFTRFSSQKDGGPILRILTKPGLWLQRLTTQEPDDSQLEVALTALRQTLFRERSLGVAQQAEDTDEVTVYPTYPAIQLPVL
jgi:uncharacterized protein YqhQ